jgi:TIR domain
MAIHTRKRKSLIQRDKPTKTSPYKVFISHSSLDKWIAERMAEKIYEIGAQYWLDVRDLEGGGNIREEINKGVRESQEVIVLFSPNSVDSHWVSFEIGAASVKKRHLTPILNNVNYKDVQLIQGMKAIDLNNFGQYLTELKKRIKKWSERRK